MKAIIFRQFGAPPTLEDLPDPSPPAAGVVIKVGATGLCRSDWHGWMGHDPGIRLPHVPGHELAGVIVALGSSVRTWRIDDRVTLPFVCGCGSCRECLAGDPQVCPNQFQPGFTHWGSFAEYVAIDFADQNLVRLPEEIPMVTAASLGCRFVTAFRAIVDQGRAKEGEWVAVHGAGGLGLSAIMIAHAIGARVVAVDIDPAKLRLATDFGAEETIDARVTPDVVSRIHGLTDGGAHLSLDCLGSPGTCRQSILSLRRRGRHVQAGLLLARESSPRLPMDQVVAKELEILGVHGMQAHRYPVLLEMIQRDRLQPGRLIQRTIPLARVATALPDMARFPGPGITVIDRF